MQPVEDLIQKLRQNGLKITPQRRVILELLAGHDNHPTVDEIYQLLMDVMPEVSRTTIYNTLRELVDLGELAVVEHTAEIGTRYDTNPGVHHHLICTRCHALVDIDLDFAGLELSQEEAAGYRLLTSRVTFYGICPDCQAK